MTVLPKRLADEIATLGVEYRDDPAPSIKGDFYHNGKALNVLWSSIAFEELTRFHGANAGEELIDLLLSDIRTRLAS